METKVKKWLFDALEAGKNIQSFCLHKSFNDYQKSVLLQSAVERQFEILGEALRRIRDQNQETYQQIPNARHAISFRNMLAHEYGHIDNSIVWSIIQDDLPEILLSVSKLLS